MSFNMLLLIVLTLVLGAFALRFLLLELSQLDDDEIEESE